MTKVVTGELRVKILRYCIYPAIVGILTFMSRINFMLI